jgi:plasmid stabilization system protein ParE
MQIEVAASFERRFGAIAEFMREQDPESGQDRIERLERELFEFIEVVKLHPEIGRPVTALYAKSSEGQRRLLRVLNTVSELRLDGIREYVLHRHTILYAHSKTRLVLLSIRHQRELSYAPDASRD